MTRQAPGLNPVKGAKMEINEILQLVISNGFAIVVAIWCLKFTFDTMTKQFDKTSNQIAELTQAVNNNTAVLQHFVSHMDDAK
jgi:hypothetical protein